MKKLFLILLGFSFISLIPLSYAQTFCFENATCSSEAFINSPLEATLLPYTEILGDWTYIIIWGAIMGSLYYMTRSAGITSMVGVFYAGVIATGLIDETALGIGYALVGITIGLYAVSIFFKTQYV